MLDKIEAKPRMIAETAEVQLPEPGLADDFTIDRRVWRDVGIHQTIYANA